MIKISIVLPTYNEKTNIIILVNKIIKITKDFPKKEIIIVDDSSPDGTYEHAKEKFKSKNYVKIYSRKKNFSLGASVGFGITKSKGNKIIVMDTDLTHDPRLIPKLIECSKKFDLVSGSRFSKGGSMYSFFHYTCSLFFNYFLRLLLKSSLRDNLGSFFCINKKALKI